MQSLRKLLYTSRCQFLIPPWGGDICLERPCEIKTLTLESTPNTVLEGNKTVALLVHTTTGLGKLKEVFLSHALAFNEQVVPEPLKLTLSRAYIDAVDQHSSADSKASHPALLDSLVKVMDYPEHKGSLLTTQHIYREITTLPGEPLGATDKAEHHIKLKPDTKPVYIPAYRLPHSQRLIVGEKAKEMLKQGVIQSSRSPWNSPLFIIPKKDGQFRPVTDFRKASEVTQDDRYPLPVLSDLLMSLGHGSKIFSSLDLLSGYWHVPTAP